MCWTRWRCGSRLGRTKSRGGSSLSRVATIVVLAGVNGAGKNSIPGGFTQKALRSHFNPDNVAREIRSLHPGIAEGRDQRFETKPGGRTRRKINRAGHRILQSDEVKEA